MGCIGSVVLAANLVFLIVKRFTCSDAVTQRTKTLKNFQTFTKFSVNFSRKDLHVSGNKSVSWFIIFDIKNVYADV